MDEFVSYIIIDNHCDFPYIIIYLGKGHNMIIYDYVAYINDYVVKAPNIPQWLCNYAWSMVISIHVLGSIWVKAIIFH